MTTRRRLLVALGLAVLPAPPSALAQPQPRRAARIRIGYLTSRPVDFETGWLDVFRQGLRELLRADQVIE